MPSNLLTNTRFEKPRSLLLTSNLIKLIDLGSNVFDQAAVDTCIFIVSKLKNSGNQIKTFVGNINQKTYQYSTFKQSIF